MNLQYIKLGSREESDDLKQEFQRLLDELNSIFSKKNIIHRVIRLTIFYKPNSHISLPQLIKESIKDTFQKNLPTVCVLAQPPLGSGGNFLAEASYLTDASYTLENKEHNGIPYIIAKNQNEEHIFASGLCHQVETTDILQQSVASFELLEDILTKEHFSFKQIVRQWNYIEGIISNNDVDNQHYQIFNDVRTHYYSKNDLISGYPAATGIGIKEGGVIIEVHACKSNDATYKSLEIKNPEQIDAFEYSEDVLEGEPCEGFVNKSTPKFARARLLTTKKEQSLLISGTASIHGEETIGIDDVTKQTQITIENINELFNVTTSQYLNVNNTLDNSASFIRVYVKTPSDYETVNNICSSYFNKACVIIVEADVCRDNLLVEIEGAVHFN